MKKSLFHFPQSKTLPTENGDALTTGIKHCKQGSSRSNTPLLCAATALEQKVEAVPALFFAGAHPTQQMQTIARDETKKELYFQAIIIAQRSGQVCADDLRDRVDIPKFVDKRLIGNVLKTLAKRGVLRKAGYTNSRVPNCHGRPICVFEYVGATNE